MSHSFKSAILLAALAGLCQTAPASSGSSMPAPMPGPSARSLSPDEMAVEAYNSGLDHRNKGQKLEQKAAAEQSAARQKNEAKARSEYEKALKDFKKAAELSPRLFQAYNGMGYAYRKTGDYTKALEMYDRALQMKPGFPEAVEYRGEAYLALNRLDDAKQAYLALFASDRSQADLLMKAMKEWITKRHADPAGVDPAAISAFESWTRERAEVAGDTASMALKGHQASWKGLK